MKVLVAGSSDRRYDLGPDHFKAACATLGEVLAERRDQLILLSDADPHADGSILKGYLAVADKVEHQLPEILISYGTSKDPENRDRFAKKFEEQRNNSKALFRDFNAEGDYPFNRVSILRDADVLVVIGGTDGVEELSEIAYALGRPIVPIESFGGTAERIYMREIALLRLLDKDSADFLTRPFMSIAKDDMRNVMKLAEKLIAKDRRIEEQKREKISEVGAYVRRYAVSAVLMRSVWYGLQSLGLLTGFAATVLLLLKWGEASDWRKDVVTVLPSVGSFAATVLVFFGVQGKY